MRQVKSQQIVLKYLGINTYKDPVVYLREDCVICQSEGFRAQTRVLVTLNHRHIIATLHIVESDILKLNEASLSNYAWNLLKAKDNDVITISHPKPLDSLRFIRSKIYGFSLNYHQTESIIQDVVSGQLSDIHIGMYIAASGGNRLSRNEILDLTSAMINTGQKLTWACPLIVDKHSIGGLPGNRTTPIVVSIVAAYGLYIPKTSSRAITSPTGTADTMEVFTNVSLNLDAMKRVVEKEYGCLVWGGAISLSPADDLLIRIERTINLDSIGQMVASILSKKIAAGSNHIVIDLPIGTTVKVKTLVQARQLRQLLHEVADHFGVKIRVNFTDGSQPIGRGIGPALEARDVFAVLNNHFDAPDDLREQALRIAGQVLEFCPKIKMNDGLRVAREILTSGRAFKKFHAICEAQGGFYDIPHASFKHTVVSKEAGAILNIDNRYIATIAKLAGAPDAKAAGIELLVKLDEVVEKSQPLFVLHAETKGQLNYALNFLHQGHDIFQIEKK